MKDIMKREFERGKRTPVTINCLGEIKKISREKLYNLILKEEVSLYGSDYQKIIESEFNKVLSNLHKIERIEIFEDCWVWLIFSDWWLHESSSIFLNKVSIEMIDFFDRI